MNMTKEQRIALHKQFLGNNWSLLASFSWQNYIEKGRGAVVVPEADILSEGSPKLAPVRMRYLPAGKDELPGHNCWGQKESRWSEDYDPEKRVILIVLRDAEGVSSYLIGGNPPPPEAYEKSKASQN